MIKSLRKIVKTVYLRQIVIYVLTWCLVLNTSLPVVLATPSGGVFTYGTGTINPVAGGNTTVTVNDPQSIIQWGSPGSGGIDTSSAESLSFLQASGLSNSAVLNRIMSGNMTQFNGTLNGLDMRIFIVNPAGVVFGDGATINVTQLVASGLDMSNADFLNAAGNAAQKMIFSGGSGDVTVNGTLDATNTGSLYLVGKNVYNNGSILCPNGLVVMAAGDAVQLGQPGSSVIVTLADLTANVDNVVNNTSGTVGTAREPVDKLVLAAGDVWSQAISNVKKVKVASVGSIGIDNLDTIDAYSNGGSDAVSTVDIVSGGDISIDDNVSAIAEGDGENNAIATVNIDAGNKVTIEDAEVRAEAHNGATNTATVNIAAGGDVEVLSYVGGYSSLYANASYGINNTAGVLICADGGVKVYGKGGDAAILAEAVDYDSAYTATNNASVGIGAKGDEGVEVRAEQNGSAYIDSRARYGYENTANTTFCTKGSVQVVDKSPVVASAGIIAEATDGFYTDAYVGVRAEDDIMVMAGIGPEDLENLAGGSYQGTGGHAEIRAEAVSSAPDEETSANAETVVYSIHGGVIVMDVANTEGPQKAEITSRASDGYTNKAYTGVYAGGDLFSEGDPLYVETQGVGVAVAGIGDISEAAILSETYSDYYSDFVNTSDTVVCTPAKVLVDAESEIGFSVAEIGTSARGEGYGINTATTQVYASDVDVTIPAYSGTPGISSHADGLKDQPHVPYTGDSKNYDPVVDEGILGFVLTEYDGDYGYHDLVWVEGGAAVEDEDIATLRIRDYSLRQDCPEAPKCPFEEPTPKPPVVPAAHPYIPPAPLPERLSFEVEGYPALMSWVAKELGVEEGNIQIGVPNTLASEKGIQPYNAFTRLKKVALILQDAGGEYIKALAQVISQYASSNAPPTEEQMASIANVISSNAGANNQYALAGEYLDALAEYVKILHQELGFTTDQAVQLAMNNYVNKLAGDNTAVSAYVNARLTALGGS